jgi:hypothetical protein
MRDVSDPCHLALSVLRLVDCKVSFYFFACSARDGFDFILVLIVICGVACYEYVEFVDVEFFKCQVFYLFELRPWENFG